MISSNEELPLVDGATKKRVSVDVLRRKIVMLFISDLDISHEELFVLIYIYNDTHQQRTDRNYELVWLPVTDRHFPWDNSKEETFNLLASNMPWYSLYHPSLLEPAVVRYIREIWHFDKRPQLVVLDPQGKVVCPNALHMMWIWGSLAFPFTGNREEALWKDKIWSLEFLVDEIDPVLLGWIREGRHVCLYGGEDIAWIRQFTTAMRRVSREAWVWLGMVYVGKSRQRDRVREAITTVIADEKLSGYWQDPVMAWFFWVRLESMWHSKMQHGRTIENDPIMKEVTTMLTFDGGDEGWAIVSRGSLEMVKSNGRKMVECLGQFDKWKANVETEGFVPALANALVTFQAMSQYCSSLILRDDIDRINEPLVCNVCKRPIDPLVRNVCNRPIDRPINPLVCNVCKRPIDRPINPLVCNVCNRPIDPFVLYAALDERAEKKHGEAFQTLLQLFKALHLDNTKILKAMISSKDELPLVDGVTKKRMSVDVLRWKIVMLFISDLDISHEEFFVLIQIYSDTYQQRTDRNYEVVWLPVTDRHFPWGDSKEETFNWLASTMPWYSLYHPSLLEPAAVMYIRKIWHFDKRPQLVVLDPQGTVVCPNALHMMWIWGSLAFPFTSSREEVLWKDETWRLEFLVDKIDPVLLGWIREGRHVCLYGGEDIAWIRLFTTAMRRVSQEAWVPLEMVYVGRSRQRDRVREAITVIADEKLSGYWQDPMMVRFFWLRLESMWHSKMQHGRTIENDPIMKEVTTMLRFDRGDAGWAIVSRGSLDIAKANGRKMVECLSQFDEWKPDMERKGLVPALANALQKNSHNDPLLILRSL